MIDFHEKKKGKRFLLLARETQMQGVGDCILPLTPVTARPGHTQGRLVSMGIPDGRRLALEASKNLQYSSSTLVKLETVAGDQVSGT